MKAKEVKKGVYWVGGVDWELRSFHGYATPRGSTYNAYLIVDEKVTLIDTVKQHLAGDLMERIRQIIEPSRIDYVVVNHVEMDHSGSLPQVMKEAQNATVVTCAAGERGLKAHFDCTGWKFKIVKSGDSFSTGKNEFHFLLTPMVHWPDNMLTYLKTEQILFSNDSFGQHLASSERFDDELPLDIVVEEAAKYYANIVLPYSSQVQKELEEAGKLDIKMIAPSHGVIWRSHVPAIVEKYKAWASNRTRKKAVIVYDTMWHSTEKMARAVLSAFENRGYETAFFHLETAHNSEVITALLEAEYVCVGSPTLNNNILPTVASFLTYLKGLSPKGRKAVAFGSYGWGGQSPDQISQYLADSGFVVKDTIKFQYVPSIEDLKGLADRIEKLV